MNLSSLQIVDIAEEAGVEYWETKAVFMKHFLTRQTFKPGKLNSKLELS